MKVILLSGWTTLEPKASYQIEEISNLDYHVTLITPDTYGRSLDVLERNSKSYSFIKCPKRSPLFEQFIILKYLLLNKNNIKYLICTAFSYTSLITLIICKILKINSLLIEWGSLTDLPKVNPILRFLAINSYRVSKKIAYKEPHLKRRIKYLFKKKEKTLFHLPNCIKIKNNEINRIDKLKFKLDNYKIDFLWANRPIWRRYPEYFLQAAIDKRFENDVFRFYGLNNRAGDIRGDEFIRLVNQVKSKDSRIINDYSFEINKIFETTKFFIFAAKDVYGNNSLLEAMSQGIIPIVSDTPWTREFVELKSALVFRNSYSSFLEVLMQAKQMSSKEYINRSAKLISWVKNNFSSEKWKNNFINLIKD